MGQSTYHNPSPLPQILAFLRGTGPGDANERVIVSHLGDLPGFLDVQDHAAGYESMALTRAVCRSWEY